MSIDLRELFVAPDSTQKKFIDALLRAIKDNALDKFDYIKFKKSVMSLQGMNLDEETAFKSAFATASTLGTTKENLLRTSKHYQNVLNKEKLQFAEAMKNQLEERVSKKLKDTEELKLRIKEYEQKITKMQREMQAYQKKIQNVDTEIEKSKAKIESTRENFMAAYEAFSKTIEEDILLINQYL